MTENKRFTYDTTDLNFDDEIEGLVSLFYDNDKQMTYAEVLNKLNKLHEENKELQERNNRQAKRLDDIYQLIEQKDWRALSDIMDDFKKAEEQLQSEWQTYGG